MTDAFIVPPNERPVDALYVMLSVDENGNEGICGMVEPFPAQLVTANPKLVEYFKQQARDISAATGRRVSLVRFTAREKLWGTDQ